MEKKIFKQLSIALVVVLLAGMAAVLIPMSAFAAVQESYTTGDDGNSTVYGVNWESQLFTTGNATSHTVDTVRLKVYRVGTPGIVTVSLRDTLAGNVTGDDLTTAVYSCDAITTDTDGEWITFDFSPNLILNLDTQYAIVVRALSGNVTSSLQWRADTTAPAFAGGYREYSADSGATWADDTSRDFMFEINGDDTFSIYDVNVFTSVYETGDWYIVLHYNVTVPPAYPEENPSAYFNITLFQGATDIAQVPLPAWGNRPALIYISRAAKVAAGLAWGSGSVGIEIAGTDLWGTPPVVTRYMQPGDWQGVDLLGLDYWVRTTASQMETYYDTDILMTSVPTDLGNITLGFDNSMLSIVGGEMFLEGVYGLDILRPHLFYLTTHSPEMDDTAFTHAYSGSIDWEARMGPQFVTAMEDTSDLLSMPDSAPKQIAGLFFFLGYLVVTSVGVWRVGSPAVASGIAIPFLAGAMWAGLIPFAAMAIIGLLCIFLTVWIVFLRST